MADYNREKRKYVIGAVATGIVLIYIVRLFTLQIMSDDYKKNADSNAFLKKIQYPSRGVITDRNGKLLVYNQPSYDIMVVMNEQQGVDTLDLCASLGITKEYYIKRMDEIKDRHRNPGYSRYTQQLFMSQLSSEEFCVFQEKLFRFPGFYVQRRSIRQYQSPYAALVLGDIGEVSPADVEEDEYYQNGDFIGKQGVERAYEKQLRGEKGIQILLRDARGRIKGRYMDGKLDTKTVPGKNLTLGLDLELQALGERLMEGKLGSIVAIEPSTGEVLCMVSSPTYDPRMMVGRQRGKNHLALSRNPLKPLLNRSIMGQYPPGSTFKTTQALTFLQEEVITTETLYTCAHGYTGARNGKPACHGHASPLNVTYALATSCNSFFCWGLRDMIDSRRRYSSVGEAFEVWKNYLVSMGYGYKLGIDLPGENRGFLPNSEYYNKYHGKRWSSSTVISIAIGQGEVLATPLQICNLAATIANRGYFITPHVVKEVQDTPLDSLYTDKRYTMVERKNYEIVAEGMRNAVIGGTCRGAAITDIEVCGKTGTAENPHGKDHSAFIGFAPYRNPKVAICVYVENGGFGATYGVPIGKLMMEKYLKGEISEENKLLEETMSNAVVLPNVLSLPNREL